MKERTAQIARRAMQTAAKAELVERSMIQHLRRFETGAVLCEASANALSRSFVVSLLAIVLRLLHFESFSFCLAADCSSYNKSR